MNLTTPGKIRNLQRKLYCKAKAEPIFRFYLLYDKICREDILVHAYRLARLNAGAPGVDGMTFARIEKQGLEAWLAGLRAGLVSKTYRPDPVRRMMIPKANVVTGFADRCRKSPRQDRSHKPWGEANRRARCGKSACCVRRGGGWKRGTVEMV